MRKVLMSAAVAALLVACSPPAQRDTAEAPQTPPTVVACNDVTPDASKPVTVGDELAVAAAASDLRGGSIMPGTYDLVSASRIGAATGWQGAQSVALDIAEAQTGGVTFNWAGTTPGGAIDRWTASFTDTPQVRLSYTCGRVGDVEADFNAEADGLQLRLPDGASGRLQLNFERRG